MALLDYELKYKVPRIVNSAFISGAVQKNEEFCRADLAKSGLEPADMGIRIAPIIQLDPGALAGYTIPYMGLDGTPIVTPDGYPAMYRTRFQLPEFSKNRRYTQPDAEQLAKYNLPPTIPYIHPLTLTLEADTLVCCEGEKKTVAVIKHLGLPAFGIGGYQMWRSPDGSGGIHPWIKELLRRRNCSHITIIPDGDVYRYDICRGYGTFARALETEGIEVRIINPRDKIDDLLVRWGKDASDNFQGLETIRVDDLVQSIDSLVKKFGLAFRLDSKNRPIVHQHTANIMKLMEEHNAFPKIWRNLDNNRVMVGEEAAVPDLTEMQIANYFQYNLGFDKVGHKTVYACIQSLAKQNSRSPFLDYVRNQSWDGASRLDSWLQRLWGVEDTTFNRQVGTRWLLSACARLDNPGTKIDWMMIVVGPQGVGKTSMPAILFKGNSLTLYGEQNDKDLHMLMHSSLCVGFDELDSFGKRESSNLKAMITRNEDSFRPPYGASVEVFPRRFTLYGCGNRYEFLQHDPSGYRRYAIIESPRLLNFAGLERERDQLWAEAWHRYKQGEKFWEVDEASEHAQKYAVVDIMSEKIEAFLWGKANSKIDQGKATSGKVYFTMTELLQHMEMERESRNSSVIRDLSANLHAKGIVKPEKSTRHPDNGAVGKWYIWTPPE